MATTLTTERPVDTMEVPVQHRARLQQLLAERDFRLEQRASLAAEQAPTPRHESVRAALRMAGTTALAEVDAALERLADGSYGRCLTCHGEISANRLDTLPMAALCTPCHWNEQNCRTRYPR
jgi:DnaK suppressor protein